MGDEPASMQQRLQAGDEAALAELFDQHRARLGRMVRFRMDRRLRSRLDMDDVLQEGYLAALKRLPNYGKGTVLSPFVWLRTIVSNALVDLHRYHLGAQKRAAGRETPLQRRGAADTTATSMAMQLTGHLTSPTQAAVRAELFGIVEQALDGMDAIDREVLALRHFEHLTNSEAAEALGIQQKAASIRYVRALRRLKGILSDVPGFFGDATHA